MIAAGVRDLKNNLSRYLSSVRKGKVVLITEHGKPIARIIQESPPPSSWQQPLSPLVKKGAVQLPLRNLNKDLLPPLKLKGKMLSKMISEDRR